MGSRKNIFEVCIQFGHAVSKTFASPDIVVVPTVKPRRPRQASNRIRVERHGMRIKVWILLGNVQLIGRKWNYTAEMGFRKEEIEARLCNHEVLYQYCWSSKFCSQIVRYWCCYRAALEAVQC